MHDRTRIGQPAASVVTGRPTVALPGVDVPRAQERVSSDFAAQQARSRALFESLVHVAQNETFESVGQETNPTIAAGVGEVVVVDFTVGDGQLAVLNKIAVDFSNPVYVSLAGWALNVNGGRVPNVLSSVGLVNFNSFVSFSAGVMEPVCISPIYLQSGQTVELVVLTNVLINQGFIVTARLSGRIIRPATPLLMGVAF